MLYAFGFAMNKHIHYFAAACAGALLGASCAVAEGDAPAMSALDEEFGRISGELIELQMDLRDKQAVAERMLARPKAETEEAKAIRKRIAELKAELAEAEEALREENAKDPEIRAKLDEIEADKASIAAKGQRLTELRKLRAEAEKAAAPRKPKSVSSHTPPPDAE